MRFGQPIKSDQKDIEVSRFLSVTSQDRSVSTGMPKSRTDLNGEPAPAGCANGNREASLFDAARTGCGNSFDQLTTRCRAYLLHIANQELSTDLQAKVGASDLVQET